MTVADGIGTAGIGAIVLDIEGTTTPISFVYDVLFPYARRHLRDYLTDRWNSSEVQGAIERLRVEWSEDVTRGENPPPWFDDEDAGRPSAAAYLEWLMDRDRKSPGLKLLQGYIWESGYASGELNGAVFPDVPSTLKRWRRPRCTVPARRSLPPVWRAMPGPVPSLRAGLPSALQLPCAGSNARSTPSSTPPQRHPPPQARCVRRPNTRLISTEPLAPP